MKPPDVFNAGRDRAEHLLKLAELLQHAKAADSEGLGQGFQDVHALAGFSAGFFRLSKVVPRRCPNRATGSATRALAR
jgi:hypothetical protein